MRELRRDRVERERSAAARSLDYILLLSPILAQCPETHAREPTCRLFGVRGHGGPRALGNASEQWQWREGTRTAADPYLRCPAAVHQTLDFGMHLINEMGGRPTSVGRYRTGQMRLRLGGCAIARPPEHFMEFRSSMTILHRFLIGRAGGTLHACIHACSG
jgi:hypothetical protein